MHDSDTLIADQAVDRFQQAWRDGEQPDLSDYAAQLDDANAAARENAIYRLIQIDRQQRERLGESIEWLAYQKRFPSLDLDRLNDLISLPAPPAIRPPLLPNRYRPLEVVGRGGLGVVWRVHDGNLDRALAVKVVNDDLHNEPDANRRLEQEAILTGSLQHPSVPPVVEQGKLLTGSSYFSMKLVEGRTLAEVMKGKAEDAVDLVKVLSMLQQVAEAVAFAHAQGVVHCDLKPHNVMVGRFGEVQVMDWGMARRYRNGTAPTDVAGVPLGHSSAASEVVAASWYEGQDDSERTGQLMGSPSYMAPEQAARRTKDIGPWTDVYALAAILYELLCGEPPARGATAEETLRLVRESDPQPIRVRAPSAPSDLATICEKGLARNPTDRYGSAIAFEEDLERFLQGRPILAKPASLRERTWKWIKRRPASAALIVATTIALVGVVSLAVGAGFYRQLQLAHNETVKARDHADNMRAAAEFQHGKVQDLLRNAQLLNSEVTFEKTRAETAEQLARRLLYAADMDLASRAIARSDVSETTSLLERHIPEPNEKDLRGFEWHYLNRQCNTTRLEIPCEDSVCLQFAPQKQQLWVGRAGKPLTVYSSVDGKVIQEIGIVDVRELCLAAAGDRIAVRSLTSIRVLDTATFAQRYERPTPGARPIGYRALCFSPDGTRLGLIENEQILLLNSDDGSEQLKIGRQGIARGLVLTDQSVWLATRQGKLFEFDLQGKRAGEPWNTGAFLHSLTPASKAGLVLGFGGFQNAPIALLDLNARKTISEVASDDPLLFRYSEPYPIAIHQDKKWFAFGHGAGLAAKQAPTGPSLSFIGNRQDITAVAFNSVENTIASAGADGVIRIWDVKKTQHDTVALATKVYPRALSPDGKQLAVSKQRAKQHQIWNVAERKLAIVAPDDATALLHEYAGVRGFHFHADGVNIVQGTTAGHVFVSERYSGVTREVLQTEGSVEEIASLPNGQIAVSCVTYNPRIAARREGIVTVFNPGGVAATFPCDRQSPIAYTHDGRNLAYVFGSKIVLRETQHWEIAAAFDSQLTAIGGLAFAADNQTLYAAGFSFEAWDLETGARTVYAPRQSVVGQRMDSIVLSRDGERMFAATEHEECIVLDTTTGRRVMAIETPQSPSCIQIGSDGQLYTVDSSRAFVHSWDGRPRKGNRQTDVAASPN